jgi:serine/threonine protein phosphatase PrpC
MSFILVAAAAIAVSRDHKPDQTDERQRIEEAGGFVMWAGISISLAYWPKIKQHNQLINTFDL